MTLQATPPATAASGRAAGAVKSHRREARGGMLMVTPAVVLLVVFFFVPVLLCFILAFTNARLISPEPARFNGLDNFTRLFSDPLFWTSLRNTFYFAVVVVPLQSAFALMLALLINVKVRGTNFFRTIYFIPVVTSIVVVSILWRFMYQPDGLRQPILQAVSFDTIQGPDWLNNTTTAMPAIMFMSIWQAVGFHMVIWLSGLQTIPADLYEAADTRRRRPLAEVPLRHLAGAAEHPHLHPGHHHHRGAQPVRPDQHHDRRRTARTRPAPWCSRRSGSGTSSRRPAYASAISLVFFLLVLTVSLVQRYLTRDKD